MNLFVIFSSFEMMLSYTNIVIGIILLIKQIHDIRRNVISRTLTFTKTYFLFILINCCLSIFDSLIYPERTLYYVYILIFLGIGNIMFYFKLRPKNIPNLLLKKPELKSYPRGKVRIGTIFHEQKILKKFKLNIEDIKRHIIIYGQTGTGKTWFLKNFLYQFSKNFPEIPFMLFEFKGEYSDLSSTISNVDIIRPGENFKINLFDCDIFQKEIYVEILFDSLKSCQIIEGNADFSPQMEKVLVDVLKKVCFDSKNQSWNTLFTIMDEYTVQNVRNIPMLNQTIISIKNRLRRYASGTLSSLFNFSEDSDHISDLLSKNCVIDLGHILKLGGSKEDVIFFANLILKWIWEFNMKKNPSDSLNHITIFEDASYIASRKLLETSHLSTYLEDIALLLRGKGEALITLTTTLDISKNIILNSGTKFFFKFNENPEDINYFIGLKSQDHIDINALNIGFCLAKIDSISEVFLLKGETLRNDKKRIKRKEKIVTQRKNNISFKKNKKKKDFSQLDANNKVLKSKSRIINEESNHEGCANEMQINKDETHFSLTKLIQQAEELYLIENYRQSTEILSIVLHDLKKNSKNFINIDHNPDIINEINDIIDKKIEKSLENEVLSSNEILNMLNITKRINQKYFLNKIEVSKPLEQNHLPLLNQNPMLKKKVDIIQTEKKINNQSSSAPGIMLFYFNMITGPEKYYEINKLKLPDHIEQKIAKSMDTNSGEFCLEIEGYFFYINIFSIESIWARGKEEIIQLVIFYNLTEFNKNFMLSRLKKKTHSLIKALKQRKTLFYAFYLLDPTKMHIKGEEIKKESIFIKMEVKKIYNHFVYQNNSKHKIEAIFNKEYRLDNIDFEYFNSIIEELLLIEKSNPSFNSK
ncbi:hypothetical protein WKT22_02947 [Candidatus Lokiarchaeum ossiferum]